MAKTKRAQSIFKRIFQIDRFSSPVLLNVNGRSEISSIPGTVVTLILFIVLTSYALKKGQIFLFKENPTIQEATYSNYYDKDYQVSLKELGFKIAFGVNDYKTGEPLDDPNYVKWIVRMNDYVNQRSV